MVEVLFAFLAEEVVSFFLGFVGGTAYHRYRIWKLKRHAPSAEVVTASVSLSQRDYDGLPEKVRNTQYIIID